MWPLWGFWARPLQLQSTRKCAGAPRKRAPDVVAAMDSLNYPAPDVGGSGHADSVQPATRFSARKDDAHDLIIWHM